MSIFNKLKSILKGDEDYEDDWEDEDVLENDEDYSTVEEDYDQKSSYRSTSKRNKETPLHNSIGQGSYNMMHITIHEPITYEDGPKILNDVKSKKIVLINFEMLEIEKKKQIFEFVNGGIYSLEAQIQKVTKDIFVIAPKGVSVEGRIREKLSEPEFKFN